MAQIDDIHAENTGRVSLPDDDDKSYYWGFPAKILASFVLCNATD
jgi:hypothetical protein